MKFKIGQKVLIEGTVVESETGNTRGVRVFNPTLGYASDYDECNVKPIKETNKMRRVAVSKYLLQNWKIVPYGKGFFHEWTIRDGMPAAIIERDSGQVEVIDAELIRFIDE